MAYAYVQKGYSYSGNTVAWQGATTAGNLLVVAIIKTNTGGEFVSSGAGNVNTSQPGWASCQGTINTIGSKILTGSSNVGLAACTLLYLPGGSNAGGDTTTTFTLTGDTGGSCDVMAMEFSGIAATSPFINYSLNAQSAAGTGTDAVTSNTVNVSTVNALLAGFGVFDGSSGGTITGTGFAGRGVDAATPWFFFGEDKRITSISNVACTFTQNIPNNTIAIGIAFAEPATALPLAVRQACVADSGATSVLFQNGSFASATLAGSAILVVCKGSSVGGNAFTSFADSINGNYQALDQIADVTALGIFKAFLFPNAASIGIAQSLTINASVSEPHLGFVAFEIQGVPAAALAAHTVALKTIASTSANAVSSNQVQAGVGSAIAIGVSINTTGNNGVLSHPSIGTGFTICPSPGGNFWSAFGTTQATAEFQTYTNPGGISATFTAQGATSDDYVTFIAVFNSIGGAFVPPFTLTQFFVNDQYIQM